MVNVPLMTTCKTDVMKKINCKDRYAIIAKHRSNYRWSQSAHLLYVTLSRPAAMSDVREFESCPHRLGILPANQVNSVWHPSVGRCNEYRRNPWSKQALRAINYRGIRGLVV